MFSTDRRVFRELFSSTDSIQRPRGALLGISRLRVEQCGHN